MAIAFHRVGPVLVYFGANAETLIGTCEDRIDIVIQPFFDDIHTDHYGGLAGPFAERQFLGGIAQIQCVLTKYDETEVNKLSSFKVAGTYGTFPAIGSFVYQDSLAGQLELKGTQETIVFDYAHVAMAFSFNASARHKRYQLGFIARVDEACAQQLWTSTAGVSCDETP